jgi:hypothetical protein
MLSQQDKARVRKDFVEWTGGYGASEVEPEKISLYVELAMPDDLDPAEVDEYLTEWAFGDD